MTRLKLLRAMPLVAISLLEVSIAFVRSLVLTRLLDAYEFGFASALSAVYFAVEQITDMAIFRFVLSTGAERYGEALAVAHAVAIARGFAVALLLAAATYPTACVLTGCSDWPSFSSLCIVLAIRGFEHFEIRVGERSYRYGPILAASAASHGAGLVAMIAAGQAWHTHAAFVAYMLVQSLVYVGLTHVLARSPYQVRLRSPLMPAALGFGLPLMLNGLGIAIYSQGDRLLVGAMAGIETLGHYAVTILLTVVPTIGLNKVLSPIYFAGLHNAGIGSARYVLRRKLFARSTPIIAASYAVALCATLKFAMPFLFGPRFTVSDTALILVAFIAFLRACRGEPMTTLLIQLQATKRLAISSQAPFAGLLAAAGFLLLSPTLESALAGVLIGEIASLISLVLACRSALGSAFRDYVVTVAVMVVFVAGAAFAPDVIGYAPTGHENLIVTAIVLLAIAGVALKVLPRPYAEGYLRKECLDVA